MFVWSKEIKIDFFNIKLSRYVIVVRDFLLFVVFSVVICRREYSNK